MFNAFFKEKSEMNNAEERTTSADLYPFCLPFFARIGQKNWASPRHDEHSKRESARDRACHLFFKKGENKH